MVLNDETYNEYQILTEIVEDEKISQRKLSKKLGISLGTVNTLINKMIRDGMIKMEQVTKTQVAYMLTPMGLAEKAKKTVGYLKAHYRAIYETKEKIKDILKELNKSYKLILILKTKDEISDVIDLAITEYKAENKQKNKQIKIINENYDLNEYQKIENVVILYALEDEVLIEKIVKLNDEKNNVKVINLFEVL